MNIFEIKVSGKTSLLYFENRSPANVWEDFGARLLGHGNIGVAMLPLGCAHAELWDPSPIIDCGRCFLPVHRGLSHVRIWCKRVIFTASAICFVDE